jgi:TetR/AcrR family transcriptional regulator, regulator of autoinduction and epiphytic fitness
MVNMQNETTAKRRYHSPQRQLQAELTRRKLLDAARRLFAANGYAATSLPAIAREAGVSTPTITAIFATKVGLLTALLRLVVGGDEEPVLLIERPWWQAMLAEPDARRLLAIFVAHGRQIHERSADVAAIMQGAATAEPEIAAMIRQLAEGRLRDTKTVAAALAEKGALASEVTVEQAADIIWTLGSHDLYRMFVTERGWTSQQYERWLAASLIHDLLERHGDASTGNDGAR